jgi:hypothetical protein
MGEDKIMIGRTALGTNTFSVTAKRWKHGWELHIDGVGVTQSRTLDTAEQMVRDYIETLTDQDVSNDRVVIIPDLGELDRKVATVRELLATADRQQQEARNSYRALAADLRAAGLSVSDTAAILGVSRGRVSQLSKALQLRAPQLAQAIRHISGWALGPGSTRSAYTVDKHAGSSRLKLCVAQSARSTVVADQRSRVSGAAPGRDSDRLREDPQGGEPASGSASSAAHRGGTSARRPLPGMTPAGGTGPPRSFPRPVEPHLDDRPGQLSLKVSLRTSEGPPPEPEKGPTTCESRLSESNR